MSWLYRLFRASLSLFSSCKSSDLNSRPSSSFSRIKWIKTNHFWTTPSTMLLSPASLSSCTSRFSSLQIFSLHFSDFLSFPFFVFDLECLFWVSALDLRLLSSNLSVMSSRSCLFSERSSPSRPVTLISSLVFD